MAIEGSVLLNVTTAGENTITLPNSSLQIVGIFHNFNYLKIRLSPGTDAILPNLGTGYRRVLPVHFTPGTNQVFINSGSSTGYVVLYYGTPLPGSKPLSAYSGVVVTATTTASGTGTLTPTFPKGTGKLTGFTNYCTASYVETSFNIATGKTLYFFDTNNERLENDNITPLNVSLADNFTLNYTAGGALSFYAIFYYA
jgi:hypothetical protein